MGGEGQGAPGRLVGWQARPALASLARATCQPRAHDLALLRRVRVRRAGQSPAVGRGPGLTAHRSWRPHSWCPAGRPRHPRPPRLPRAPAASSPAGPSWLAGPSWNGRRRRLARCAEAGRRALARLPRCARRCAPDRPVGQPAGAGRPGRAHPAAGARWSAPALPALRAGPREVARGSADTAAAGRCRSPAMARPSRTVQTLGRPAPGTAAPRTRRIRTPGWQGLPSLGAPDSPADGRRGRLQTLRTRAAGVIRD